MGEIIITTDVVPTCPAAAAAAFYIVQVKVVVVLQKTAEPKTKAFEVASR